MVNFIGAGKFFLQRNIFESIEGAQQNEAVIN